VAQTIDGSRIRITFDHAEGLRAAQEPLEGFAVAGADGRYQWAAATIEDGAVVVESAKVPQPLRVRYAWDEDPAGNLVNAAGLPAIPFQSAP
jgi:sialate O-acetylesterase